LNFTLEAGNNGADSVQPSFSIGNVTAVNNGTDPSVTLTGTQTAPVINFVLERGPTGNTREKWIQEIS
jgi:hypothetical protein